MSITLLDGSCGSALWAYAERDGIERVPTWKYTLEHPELVSELHRAYISAGSEMVQTNTFCVNRPAVSASSDYSVRQLIIRAVELAREAAEGTGTGVYLSCGPVSALLQPYGKLSADECADIYKEIFEAASECKPDMLMLETFMDLRMMEIAACEAVKTGIPVACSMTFEKKHRTMMGDRIEKICKNLSAIGAASVGMNCSYGPVEGLEIIKEFAEYTELPLYFKPNAGVGESCGPDAFANELAPSFPLVSYIGGCCGTDSSYISAIKARI